MPPLRLLEDGSTLKVGFRPDAPAVGDSVTLVQSLSAQPGVHIFLKYLRRIASTARVRQGTAAAARGSRILELPDSVD